MYCLKFIEVRFHQGGTALQRSIAVARGRIGGRKVEVMNTWIVSFSRQFHLETASNFPGATARRTNLGVANSSSTALHFRPHRTPPGAWTLLLRGRKPPATPMSVNQVQQMPPRWDCKLQIISYSWLLQGLRLLAARRRSRYCAKAAGLLHETPRRT